DSAVCTELQQAEARSNRFVLGNDTYGNVGSALPVTIQQLVVIHTVKLIAGQDQLIIVFATRESMQMLPDCVCRSLEPIWIGHRLFGREYFDKTFGKRVEPIGIRDVTVQRGRVELRHHKDLLQPGIQTIADRHVDETVLATQGNSRFRAILREREQTFSG